MTGDPLPDMSADEVRAHFADKNDEKDLADAYAMADNKLGWISDDLYDYEVGSPEHSAAVIIYDEWKSLIGEYEARIFEIVKRDNPLVTNKGTRWTLKPFMEKHGYIDGRGWWIKTIRSSDETF